MIELIFAIVVMGIVMLSVPQLLSTASQSGYVAIQQEAINEASTQMNIIMGHYWDENNTDDVNQPVLNTSNGNLNLRGIGGLRNRRKGTPKNSKRNFIITGGALELNASVIGQDATDMDDIDDFNGVTRTLHLEETSAVSDYIEKNTINIVSNVSYISDKPSDGTYTDPGDSNLRFDLNTTAFPAGQTTNIKHIQVTLTSTSGVNELNKTIILHAFSCNIGTYNLEERK